jgi:hypothetical protein
MRKGCGGVLCSRFLWWNIFRKFIFSFSERYRTHPQESRAVQGESRATSLLDDCAEPPPALNKVKGSARFEPGCVPIGYNFFWKKILKTIATSQELLYLCTVKSVVRMKMCRQVKRLQSHK